MALPAVSPSPPASPQVIGNAFIQQYYKILHDSPEYVHKFYQDSSILCRPDSNGVMASVTTTQAINDLILSLDFSNCYTEIETVDSQISYKNGMLIIVTGSFTGVDSVRRKFTQSFFLAPQEHGGYFVLNDVFRVLNETQAREMIHVLVNCSSDDATIAPLSHGLGSSSQEHHVEEAQLPVAEADKDIQQPEEVSSIIQNEVDVYPPVPVDESAEHPVSEADAAVAEGAEHPVSEAASFVAESAEQPVSEAASAVTESADQPVPEVAAAVDESYEQSVSEAAAVVAQGDRPKRSYASILKAMKASTTPPPVYVPTRKEKTTTASSKKPVAASTKTAHSPESNAPASNMSPENPPQEEEGYSIYIKNLPLYVTAEQIEAEFKRFGTIKPGGVQVRIHKVESFCFGFVEFDLPTSMQAAIEASPIMIGGRQAYVEEKRTTTRVVNGVVTTSGYGARGRGRFPQGRGGFRNDNFRARGYFSPNTSYRRTDYRNRFEYSGRGRGINSYQYRVYQNSNVRIGSSSEPKQTAVAAN